MLLRGSLDWMLDKKVSNIFKWADLMTKFDIPFSWASEKNYLKNSTLKSVDNKTLKKYFIRIGCLVESNFSNRRKPNGEKQKYVLLLDMWDNGSGGKMLAVFLGYPDASEERCELFLLCCTPLLEEDNATGDNQIATIAEALRRCNIEWDQILLLVADNTSVSPYIARKLRKVLIGCKTHVLAIY